MADINVFQAVAVPRKPVRSKKALTIALEMISGDVPGPGLGFFINYTSRGPSTDETGERRLRRPVIEAVSNKEME